MNARYFVSRTAHTVLLVWLILTFLFLLFRFMPGDFTGQMVFAGASEESIEAVEAKWGLNEPLYVQYGRFLRNYLTLDPGQSIQYRRPVWEYVRPKIFNTLVLVGPGITIAYVFGTIIGTVLGSQRGTFTEKFGTIPVIGIGMVPEFFTAILLILVFSHHLDLFPASSMLAPETYTRFQDAPWWRPYLTRDFAWHYVLPLATVVLRYLYLPIMVMRTSVVEVTGQDFIEYHRLTGLPRPNVLRHVGKHAILPIITMYPISMMRVLSGLVLIETVFNWPGIGHALVVAVLARDYPVVQFVFFITAVWVILANYGVDLMYSLIDPRVSVTE